MGPFSEGVPAIYLTDEYRVDYGVVAMCRDTELIHARWAMFVTLGCLTPELLTMYASVPLS